MSELQGTLFPLEEIPAIRRERARDTLWDQMEELFGRVVDGTNAAKKRNKAVKDLRLMEATPESLVRAHKAYLSQYNGTPCTDTALATHYPQLYQPPPPPPCPFCGLGAGFHAEDCARP